MLLQIPPTSILTLEPLYCSYSALRVILACKSATRQSSPLTQFCLPQCSPHSNQQLPSQPHGQGQNSVGSSAFQSQADRQQWPQLDGQQVQRHHLLLPKALPQGNLSRYFDLACITAGLRCLGGQQDAWEDAWLVLKHALRNFATEGQSVWNWCKLRSALLKWNDNDGSAIPPHRHVACNHVCHIQLLEVSTH